MPLLTKRKKRSTDLIPVIKESITKNLESRGTPAGESCREVYKFVCLHRAYSSDKCLPKPYFQTLYCCFFWSPQSLTETDMCMDK